MLRAVDHTFFRGLDQLKEPEQIPWNIGWFSNVGTLQALELYMIKLKGDRNHFPIVSKWIDMVKAGDDHGAEALACSVARTLRQTIASKDVDTYACLHLPMMTYILGGAGDVRVKLTRNPDAKFWLDWAIPPNQYAKDTFEEAMRLAKCQNDLNHLASRMLVALFDINIKGQDIEVGKRHIAL